MTDTDPIRRMAGQLSPQELAQAAIKAAERAGDAKSLRERLAVDAGLPPELGARLRGLDAGELAADAKALAATLAEITPAASMDERFRRQAGTGAVEPTEKPLPPTSFDSGARSTGPPAAPTFDSQLRAEAEEHASNVAHRAWESDR